VEEALLKKSAELKAKNSEKERQRAEQMQAKAQQRVEASMEAITQTVQSCTEAGISFTESFEKTKNPGRTVTAPQVKNAQSVAKAAFRLLSSSWPVVRKARDGMSKAIAARRKAMQKAFTVAAAEAEADSKFSEAEKEFADATEENERRQSDIAASESALIAAEAARGAAELEEAEMQRKREELKSTQPIAKEHVRLAKIAEKEANQERVALHTKCSKVEKAHSDLETAKNSAIQTLQAEAYDAGQVVKAYEKTKASD